MSSRDSHDTQHSTITACRTSAKRRQSARLAVAWLGSCGEQFVGPLRRILWLRDVVGVWDQRPCPVLMVAR